jgi:hypothetical protein
MMKYDVRTRKEIREAERALDGRRLFSSFLFLSNESGRATPLLSLAQPLSTSRRYFEGEWQVATWQARADG